MVSGSLVLITAFSAAVAQTTAEEWQKTGLQHHLKNEFTQAIPAFAEALKRNPSLWTSHLFLGIARYRTNAFAQAVESLGHAGRLAPATGQGRDEVDFWLGAARIAAGDTFAGLRSIEQLLTRQPRHVDALQLVTETYAGSSARLWNEIAERHFETAVGQHVHGLVLESEGYPANALDAYRQSRRMDARREGPAGAIGRLLLTNRPPDAKAALRELEAELALAPHNGEAAHYAGLALIQLARWPEAADRLRVAMNRMPGNPEPAVALTQVYLALARLRDAVEAAAAAVKVAPRHLAAHELLLAALGAAGDGVALQAEQARWRELMGGASR